MARVSHEIPEIGLILCNNATEEMRVLLDARYDDPIEASKTGSVLAAAFQVLTKLRCGGMVPSPRKSEQVTKRRVGLCIFVQLRLHSGSHYRRYSPQEWLT